MSNFIELKKREYYRGGYISNDMCVSLDDIARVVQCIDDYDCVNVVTKDGKIHTINERYNDVVMKIGQAVRQDGQI